jgi:hypothetical protein
VGNDIDFNSLQKKADRPVRLGVSAFSLGSGNKIKSSAKAAPTTTAFQGAFSVTEAGIASNPAPTRKRDRHRIRPGLNA